MADPLDILGRRRNGGPLRNALADQNAADPAVLDQVDAYNLDQQSAFARGAQAGAYGMTAGSFADEALNAQLAGNDAAQRALEEQALANAQRAGQVAPRVRSLRDVGSVGDFGELVGGHLGQAAATMAPVIGAGLLTRGRSMPRTSAFAGATIPAYQLEQGEAILGQLSDPELASMDPQRRAELARNKAIVNAGLESLVPAGLVSRAFGRGSPLRTVGDSMLTEGLTEGLQEGTGILAEETLRRGSLEQAVPALADDPMRLVDAGFAGAVGGGGLSLPTAGTQAITNAVESTAELGKTAAKKAVETAGAATDTAGEQAKNLRQWADKHLEGLELDLLDDDQLVSELERRSSDPEIVPRDPTDDLVRDAVRRGDLDAVQAAMAQREENAPNLRQQAAAKLLEQDDVPPPLQEMATRVMQGQASMEDEAQILGQAAGYQAGRAAKTLAARGIVAVDEAISFGKEALADGAKAVREIRKRNEQEGAEAPGLVNALFSQLKPEFRKDPEITKRLSSMVSLFANLDGQEDTTGTYDTVRRLAPALSWFENPAKALPKGLAKVYADVTRAQTEAQSDDSWLTANLTPAFQGKPAARAEVGRLIDRAALGEELGPREAQLLQRAFGSKGATQTMLRHYKMQLPLLRRERPEVEEQLELDQTQEAEDQESGEENPDYDAANQGITERDGDFTYTFAGSNRKAFLALHKKGERAPAQAKARELREAGERAEVVNLAQLARENGQDLAAEAQRLREDYLARFDRGETTAEEDVLHEGTAGDDLALLRAHQVVRTSARDNSEDKLLQAHKLRAQPLVKQARNPKASPEQRAAAKSTLFKVQRADGEMTLSAESLWKYFGDRQQKEKGERGIVEGESQTDAVRAQDLFAQAIAELALDPGVTGLELPENLVLDRKSGQTLGEDQRLALGNAEPGRVKFKRNENDAAALQALNDNDFSARAKSIANDTERSVADRLEQLAEVAQPDLEGIKGPRRQYLVRRAGMARDAMLDLVNKLVPPPSGRAAEFLDGELEAFSEAAERAYQAQGKYVADLQELVGDIPALDSFIAGAQAHLERLEERANPPREFDETTGESLLPGTKEAADRAKRVRTKNNDMALEVNGSGDSSASMEAINRYRDEQEAGQVRMLIDRDGTVRRLFGVDSVDTFARPGQLIVQRGVGKDEWTIISQDPHISKDLAAGRLNAARTELKDWSSYNRQTRKSSGIGISKNLKNEIYAEIKRITGLKNTRGEQHLFFVKAKDIGGASGQYTPAQRAIKVAISSVDPLGVAYHEALHDFIAGLQESVEGRELRKALFKTGEMPHIRAQLKELLKDHPKALEAIETDAEERIAYLFQFYAVGKHAGKELVKVRDPATLNALGRLAQWIRELLGVVSQDAKVEAVLEALYDGRMAERNVVGAVVQDMGLLTMQDKFRRLAGPLADVYDKLMLTATDRLRAFGVEPLDELADMMHREPGREKGGLPFLPRRAQRAAQFDNRKAALFDKSTAAERATALRNLQSMQEPSSPLEREVRKLLDDLYDYMDEAGVRRLKPKQKPNESATWEKIPRVKNYFPRHWDPNKILGNEAEFKALLAKHGNVSLPQQNAIAQAVVHGTHDISLADSEYHVGYTPFAQAVENRRLDFINETNAAEFAKFQQGDLADILSGYIHQAVHRAEFARDFGNAGEVIQQHLQEAAKNLDGKQVAEAGNAVKALVGTLGADVNPRLKDVMSAAITAQNVILLPLTMFSQFIDALGVGLRAQAPEEAWSAFKRGMSDFAKATRKKTREQPDYDAEMAKTLGLIDEQNMLEAMGQAHAGAFMSGFARNINRKFFRWNGMESWNKSMRVSAMVAGERFIQREIANDRYMHELGLEPNDPAIMVKPDGRLAVTAEQMIALGAKPKQAATREQKIQAALFRFVDGAVLRPNAAQRPVWGSDPHWMLIFHLKQFAFAFQKTILARVNNEFEHGKMMPAAILAAYVPVTMASGLAKATLTGQPIGDGSMLDILNYGVMRSGILGAQSFSADAFSDIERGHLPGTSLIGPTMEHAFTASRFVVGDPEIDAGRVLDRSLPFARYF